MKPKELDQLIETLTGIRAGKPWQFKRPANFEWEDPQPGASPNLIMAWGNEVRLKPWTLPPAPEGQQWHKGKKFTADDLPDGYRPLLVGENVQQGDERYTSGFGLWQASKGDFMIAEWHAKHRTKRPLPEIKPDPVPLGPEDVPPGSALRNKHSTESFPWHLVLFVSDTEVTMTGSQCLYTLRFDSKTLMSEWEILRPGQDWQPCSKEAPAP